MELHKPVASYGVPQYQDDSGLIQPLAFDAPVKNFEQKVYLLLIVYADRDMGKTWEIKVGRTAAYDYIKDNVDSIDIHESKVLTETRQVDMKTREEKYYMMNVDDMITVYDFCRHIEGAYADGFSIVDYDYTYDEEDEVVNTPSIDDETMKIWQAIRNDNSIGTTTNHYDSDEV